MPKLLTVRDVVNNMKILLYGPQGVGKTSLAATAQDHPDMKDVLFLDCEGGLLSVVSRGDIYYERIRTTEQLEEIFWKVANGDPEYRQFRTYVIDSATELQAVNIEEVTAESIEKERKKKREVTRTVDEPYLDDYGKSTNELRRLFRWFKNLPINIIITALPKYVYPPRKKGQRDDEEDRQPIEVKPDLTDKLANAVMGMVDFVWYMYADDIKDDKGNTIGKGRFLLTENWGPFRAKTRGHRFAQALGPVVKDPYLPDLFELLLKTEAGGFEEKEEAVPAEAEAEAQAEVAAAEE